MEDTINILKDLIKIPSYVYKNSNEKGIIVISPLGVEHF